MIQIYSKDTISFGYSYRSDGLHMIDEIDDDEMGFKSEVHHILDRDAQAKLFSIISEKDFIDLCRKEGPSGMSEYLDAHDIPYRREPVR